MKNGIEVRGIVPDDFPWCADVAAVRMLTDEVQRPELINQTTLYLLMNKMYMDSSALVALVDGKYAGAIGGYLSPNLLNPDITTMTELMWYVLPEYRKTRVGLMLLKEYDKLVASSPAQEGTFSLLNNSPIKHSSLEKMGFKVEEQAFRKIYKEY